jgi:hypothetical protein
MTTTPDPQPVHLDAHDLQDLPARMDASPVVARRRLRRTITLPDGRTITGWPPGTAHGRLLEHQLRDKLAAQLGGITEAVLPYGRADVLTNTAVFEVEPAKQWRHGVFQAYAYAAQTGLPPAVALFGAIHHTDLLKRYLKLRSDHWSRSNTAPVALWWWDGAAWTPISSRTRCRNMPAPTIEPR